MSLDTLPYEIIHQIYQSAPTVSSVLNLAATCHHLRDGLQSSKRLSILSKAADNEFGPIDDVIQLLTQNASQSAHVHRTVAISEALLRQIIHVGRTAQQWEDIYPLRRWNAGFANRRLLSNDERFNLRRAIYRLWLFDRAYHNFSHIRTARLLPTIMHERAALLHNFNTTELSEMLDMHLILRDVIAENICPSNGKVRAKYRRRYGEYPASQINIHLNYPSRSSPWAETSMLGSKYHADLRSSVFPDAHLEGWGDDIGHYYVVEDMMKLDPEQILFLRNHGLGKRETEAYVARLGEWFTNNGEVFSETLAFVIGQRGGDMQELKDAVMDNQLGIAVET